MTRVPAPSSARTRAASSDAISAPSPPEPDENDDDLFQLGERIADLAAGINAAESRMMTLIADFDRRGGWMDGFGSCAEWLAWRIGMKIGSARERVRTARALENLPQTADALSEGSISYAKVRALSRVATPESEARLLEFARAGSAAKLEQTVRMFRKLSREGELPVEEARHRSRTFSVFVDGDGMYVVKGRLEPEAGAVLMRAVEAASDALFRRERGAGDGGDRARNAAEGAGRGQRGSGDARPEPKQRRADAVGLLAERALVAGFGGSGTRDVRGEAGDSRGGSCDQDPGLCGSSGIPRDDTGPGDVGERGGGLDESGSNPGEPGVGLGAFARGLDGSGSGSCDEPTAPPRVESGTRAERYQVMVHCDAATLAAEGSRGARIWTGSAFPRKRPGAWHATRRWSPWFTRRTGTC